MNLWACESIAVTWYLPRLCPLVFQFSREAMDYRTEPNGKCFIYPTFFHQFLGTFLLMRCVTRHLRCLPSWRLKSNRTANFRVLQMSSPAPPTSFGRCPFLGDAHKPVRGAIKSFPQPWELPFSYSSAAMTEDNEDACHCGFVWSLLQLSSCRWKPAPWPKEEGQGNWQRNKNMKQQSQ